MRQAIVCRRSLYDAAFSSQKAIQGMADFSPGLCLEWLCFNKQFADMQPWEYRFGIRDCQSAPLIP